MTIAIVSIFMSIAVPNFIMMVQNNQIKSTTNDIVSTLQFARQTAAINNTQILACSPVTDSADCALTTQWQKGIALLEGKAKVSEYAPPLPPKKPNAPEKPIFVPVPPVKKKPQEPPFQPRATVYAAAPGGSLENKIMMSINHYNKVCPTTWKISSTYYAIIPGKTLHSESWTEYRCSGGSAKGGPYYYDIRERAAASQKALNKVQQVVDDYNRNINKIQDEYNEKLSEYIKSKNDHDVAKNTNQALQAAYDKDATIYQSALKNYEQAVQKYNDDLAKAPEQVITIDKANTVLAANPFTVTVTPKLQGGVTAVVYNKDRIKNGFGEIYIEDKRGRGEHSRTICINMLGNLKVVRGNKSCP